MASVLHTIILQVPPALSQHLNDVTKVFALNVVVCFDEDLSQDRLADGIVLGIELVEAMESVAVLQKQLITSDDVVWMNQHLLFHCSFL